MGDDKSGFANPTCDIALGNDDSHVANGNVANGNAQHEAPAQLSEIALDDSSWANSAAKPKPTLQPEPEKKASIERSESAESNVDENDKKPLKTGKVISLIYPVNEHLAWIAPPVYSFEKMPKALNSRELMVPHSEYRRFMSTITDDVRFKSYVILFSRAVPIWVMTSVILLMFMLFSSQDGGLHVMVFTILWGLMLCIGLGFCILLRKYLANGLNLVVRDANDQAIKHNLMVGVQDRGQISCHKVVLVLMYYDVRECQHDIKKCIRVHLVNQPVKQEIPAESELDSQAREFIVEHSQAYIKAYAKKQLLFPTKPSEGVSEFRPKHCQASICICQYVEQKIFQDLPLLP
ncbi:unnamed protein product [Bursaphelenchus xylophilus]|uniref:(pine wood nematode) hypothetical protein n=1 Tax=Bursaphelenchus xylophilus TaxID=6326 RepID=A0A1I7RTF2_BURXY|nr:unnamed protein product [Bursaphelenchus xylophilus]CAG9122476.1 unnamed protein product [Bursaphelenchus xylophilus]